MYCIFVSPNIVLKLWGSAFCDALGETKQILGKTSFCKSTEPLDSPRKHHPGCSGVSDDHTPKDELSGQYISFSPPGSLDTNIQEVIRPHKHLMDKNYPEKARSVQFTGIISMANCLGKGSSLTCKLWSALNNTATSYDRDICALPKQD